MKRRRFNSILAVAGLTHSEAEAGRLLKTPVTAPELIHLSRNGWMPNNEYLPVLLYRDAIHSEGVGAATIFETRFQQNGWPPQWRNGVYDFHHYHSTAHEVLGFARGHAKLMLGGENGRALEVNAGDVVVLPAGTGHCKLQASSDFLVVGAYPPAQHWDICRTAPAEDALARMRHLTFPNTDPLTGLGGPLSTLWRRS